MPELVEVERYRALAEDRALGRPVVAVDAPDAWYLKRGLEAAALQAALIGRTLTAARRRGKLLLLDAAPEGAAATAPAGDGAGGAGDAPEVVVGLHFGMSGRLLVDGEAGVDRLLYSPAGADPRFDRFALVFAGGGRLAVSDPRRLGGVELDPDEDRLGPDALGVTVPELRRALAGARVALKARLLDQSRIAGIGNLIADEVLWRAGLSPLRPAGAVTGAVLRRLHGHLAGALSDLLDRGGSHTGDLMAERRPGGTCPRDGAPLARATVGGRTTFWCPRHQK